MGELQVWSESMGGVPAAPAGMLHVAEFGEDPPCGRTAGYLVGDDWDAAVAAAKAAGFSVYPCAVCAPLWRSQLSQE